MAKILEIISSRYVPVFSSREADTRINTLELFEELQYIFPSDTYTASDVFELLTENGYRFDAAASGDLRFTWLLKRHTPNTPLPLSRGE